MPRYDVHADEQDASLQCTSTTVDHSKTVVAAVGDAITVGATCHTWRGGFVKVMQDVLGEEKYHFFFFFFFFFFF